MKIKIGNYVLPILAILLLAFSIIQVVRGQAKSAQPPPPVMPPQATFDKNVAGSGIVEPNTENINIGSPLPGVIQEVYVPVEKVGQIVKKGEPLFLVDTRQLIAQRGLQRANLDAANAQLTKLNKQPRPEEVPPAEAAFEAAKYNLAVQEDTAKRNAELIKQNAVPGKDFEQSLMLAKLANHQMLQAKANLRFSMPAPGSLTRTSPRPTSLLPRHNSSRSRRTSSALGCAPRRRQGASGQRPSRRICRHASCATVGRSGQHRILARSR